MEIYSILTEIFGRWREDGSVPRSSDPRLQSAVREAQRKIGSWRKVLWLCGLIPDARKKSLPQLRFEIHKGKIRVLPASADNLQSLFPKSSVEKRRMRP